MFVLDAISAIEFGDGELRIDFARWRRGQVSHPGRSARVFYSQVTQSSLVSPVAGRDSAARRFLYTPVATWLHVRLRPKAASEIGNQFEDLGGRAMVTDPVCGTEIEEINVPECLRSECGGKVYYFCSLECKSEFEQNQKRFVEAA